MSNKVADRKRDYEIYKEIKEIYKLEWQRTDKLNDKAIGLVTSAGVIMALYTGLGTFTLENVSTTNIYYPFLTIILVFGLIMFIVAILFGLSGYSIVAYKVTDPADLIDEYKEREWNEFIRFYGGDLKNSILENRKINDGKVKNIRAALYSITCGAITIIMYALLILFAL